jgi:hypothetical protein
MFTVPNEADAFNTNQAEVDSRDLAILASGFGRVGFTDGGIVTELASPGMNVDVSAGNAVIGAVVVPFGASANLAISAADATLARNDFVVVNDSGVVSVVAGTPSAHAVFPAIPALSAVMAAIYVPALETTILTNRITDKRILLTPASANIAGHVIQDEGTSLAQRGNLNFIGTGVTATDNAGTNSSDVTIPGVDVQHCTSDCTWTKPAGATMVKVILFAGGGGGGGGMRGVNNTYGYGGCGGGGGGQNEHVFGADDLPATVDITVGQGGAGGLGGVVVGSSAVGQYGAPGGDTSFGSFLEAYGGGGGGNGRTVDSAPGGSGGGAYSAGQTPIDSDHYLAGGLPSPHTSSPAVGPAIGLGGAWSRDDGTSLSAEHGGGAGGRRNFQVGVAGGKSVFGGAGGGGGGGITNTFVPGAGAAGGGRGYEGTTPAGGGGGAGGAAGVDNVSDGSPGSDGAAGGVGFGGNGGGGGGGGGHFDISGGAGGNGGIPAGGGGGGGFGNGVGDGAPGGDGARGDAWVFSW